MNEIHAWIRQRKGKYVFVVVAMLDAFTKSVQHETLLTFETSAYAFSMQTPNSDFFRLFHFQQTFRRPWLCPLLSQWVDITRYGCYQP